MERKVKVFKYLPVLDAFDVTDEYRELAENLGLTEWHPVVWIGRLFTLDNDFGEHWFDNWDLREENEDRARELGRDANKLFFIDPDRFQNGKDGPCHTPDFRKRFWTEVLDSLELSLDLLFEEARRFNAEAKALAEAHPEDLHMLDFYLSDLEERIQGVLAQRKQ